MKRSLAVLMFCLAIFFLPESLSARSELKRDFPRISNPDFSIRNNIVKVSFDYADVAGSIRDARIYLVVLLPVTRQIERFEVFPFVMGGWKGFFWSAEDDRKLTSGSVTAKVSLPWYFGINHETNIKGFGLAVADSRKFISNPHFIEGEIDRITWFTKISKFIMEALMR